jgi:hypothetical protein
MEFTPTLRDHILTLARMGMFPQGFTAFPGRVYHGRQWRLVTLDTTAGKIVFHQLVG